MAGRWEPDERRRSRPVLREPGGGNPPDTHLVVLVHGTEADAQALRSDIAVVLATVGLRLSEAKTKVVHIDEGFDFLGYRIQRHRKRGTAKHFVYTYPSKSSLLRSRRR